MDMSFSNQALSVKYLIQNVKKLKNEVYAVPKIIDRSIGKLKLQSMGIKIDKLDKEQKKYLNSWQHGT
jgi:adenosylhomocysteinase